jgi:hypothetical protein
MADWSRPTIEAQKVWLAGGSTVLAVAWAKVPKEWRNTVLLVLAVVCTLNFYGGTEKLTRLVDNYDLIHYYLTPRYFEELGYYDLYSAALLVDHEHEPYVKLKECRLQDEVHGYRLVNVRVCIQRGREVRERFTPERWAAFEHDFLYLQRKAGMDKSQWRTMVKDRGFNGTPAWLIVGRPLAEAIPPEAIKWLCLLDLLLLGGALVAVGYAYDRNTALWCLVFLSLTYSLRWPVPCLVYARYIWVSSLLGAMALLRFARPIQAGALAGLAAALRFFPALWMWGPFAKGIAGLFDRDKPLRDRFDRRLLVFAGGFLAAVLVLQGAAVAVYGKDVVVEHFENMREHTQPEELSSRRVGFALGWAYRGELEPKNISDERKQEIADQEGQTRLIAILVTLALGFVLRRKRDDEAFAYGAIPFFFLTTASYYYYVGRITLIAIHASDLDKWRNKVGLALLLLVELYCNWAQTTYPDYRVFLVGRMSWGITLYSVVMIGWLWYENRLEPAEGS